MEGYFRITANSVYIPVVFCLSMSNFSEYKFVSVLSFIYRVYLLHLLSSPKPEIPQGPRAHLTKYLLLSELKPAN